MQHRVVRMRWCCGENFNESVNIIEHDSSTHSQHYLHYIQQDKKRMESEINLKSCHLEGGPQLLAFSNNFTNSPNIIVVILFDKLN
jgi:hypothetical protein